jgi:pepsin A
MFDATGVQSVLTPNTTADTYPLLTGYYPCDKPPELGFGFPSITNATTAKQEHNSTISHYSTIYDMLPEALAFATNGNNCTASIFGSDEYGGWLIGQGQLVADN